MMHNIDNTPYWPYASYAAKKAAEDAESDRLLARLKAATLPQFHDTAPTVLDSDAHQFAVEYAKLSVNGKRHARAMVAGLVRLEAGAA